MNLTDWIQKCDAAQEQLLKCMEKMPNEPSLKRCSLMLGDLKMKAMVSWPPSDLDKEANKLGWFAMRNVEEIDQQLSDVLSELSYEFNR